MLGRLVIAALAIAAASPAAAQTYVRFDVLWPADTRAYCASPETWAGKTPVLASRIQKVAELRRAANASLYDQPFDEKARQAALRLRDQAALASWELDLSCLSQPLRFTLDVARAKAAAARREAMTAYEAYEREPGEAAFPVLKSTQEAMWDAREAQDVQEAEFRRLRALERQVARANGNATSNAPAGFTGRLQLFNAQNELERLEDKASPEAERLIRRIADLRADSLAVTVPPVMAMGAAAQLPAYPPGSDWQARRPAVLPVLPPG